MTAHQPDTADLARRVMEAAEKATDGPWNADLCPCGVCSTHAVMSACEMVAKKVSRPNAAFIALSRTAAPALAQAVLEKDRALAEIDRLIEFYFSPWGAAKAATWEEIDGDGPAFSAEAMLDHIRRLRARTALKDKTNG